MQTTYQQTGTALAKALSGLVINQPKKALTFGDVCRQIDRGSHTRISLEVLAGILPEMDFDAAMRRLDRVIEREAAFGKAGHWSYNSCRHLALLEHRQKLSDFAESLNQHLEAAE